MAKLGRGVPPPKRGTRGGDGGADSRGGGGRPAVETSDAGKVQLDTARSMNLRLALPQELGLIVAAEITKRELSAKYICHEALLLHLGFSLVETLSMLQEVGLGSQWVPVVPKTVSVIVPEKAVERLYEKAQALGTSASAYSIYAIAVQLKMPETDALRMLIRVASTVRRPG